MTNPIQIKRDTAANWTTNNPVLLIGTWALETDTKRYKIGDGSTAWTSLAYTDPTVALAVINGSTLATGNLASAYNNTIQTAATAATLTMVAGMSCPSGLRIETPGGATVSWPTGFTVNGVASAGTLTALAGQFFILEQMQGTNTWRIVIGPTTDLITIRTESTTLTLAAADLAGDSECASAIAVTASPQASGFWRMFRGAGVVTFTGSGVTVTDNRVVGAANPVCIILYTSSTTAVIIGAKA